MANNNFKIARGLFLTNSIASIFIGALHTYAHYSELVTPAIHQMLDHNIMVTGMEASVWNLWQGMSLMMGILLIIVGLLGISIIGGLKQGEYPPASASVIFIVMLCFVVYCGLNFFSNMQVYGGGIGLVIQTLCLFLSVKASR